MKTCVRAAGTTLEQEEPGAGRSAADLEEAVPPVDPRALQQDALVLLGAVDGLAIEAGLALSTQRPRSRRIHPGRGYGRRRPGFRFWGCYDGVAVAQPATASLPVREPGSQFGVASGAHPCPRSEHHTRSTAAVILVACRPARRRRESVCTRVGHSLARSRSPGSGHRMPTRISRPASRGQLIGSSLIAAADADRARPVGRARRYGAGSDAG